MASRTVSISIEALIGLPRSRCKRILHPSVIMPQAHSTASLIPNQPFRPS